MHGVTARLIQRNQQPPVSSVRFVFLPNSFTAIFFPIPMHVRLQYSSHSFDPACFQWCLLHNVSTQTFPFSFDEKSSKIDCFNVDNLRFIIVANLFYRYQLLLHFYRFLHSFHSIDCRLHSRGSDFLFFVHVTRYISNVVLEKRFIRRVVPIIDSSSSHDGPP